MTDEIYIRKCFLVPESSEMKRDAAACGYCAVCEARRSGLGHADKIVTYINEIEINIYLQRWQ